MIHTTIYSEEELEVARSKCKDVVYIQNLGAINTCWFRIKKPPLPLSPTSSVGDFDLDGSASTSSSGTHGSSESTSTNFSTGSETTAERCNSTVGFDLQVKERIVEVVDISLLFDVEDSTVEYCEEVSSTSFSSSGSGTGSVSSSNTTCESTSSSTSSGTSSGSSISIQASSKGYNSEETLTSSIHYSKEKYGEQEYKNFPTCSTNSELSEDDYEGTSTGYDFEIEEKESPDKGCNYYLTEPYIIDVADAFVDAPYEFEVDEYTTSEYSLDLEDLETTTCPSTEFDESSPEDWSIDSDAVFSDVVNTDIDLESISLPDDNLGVLQVQESLPDLPQSELSWVSSLEREFLTREVFPEAWPLFLFDRPYYNNLEYESDSESTFDNIIPRHLRWYFEKVNNQG